MDLSAPDGSSFSKLSHPTARHPSTTASSSSQTVSPAQTPRLVAPFSPAPIALDDIIPPDYLVPSITIEFCDRCRWCGSSMLPPSQPRLKLTHAIIRAPRATWIQTELFLTFPPPIIRAITLQPLNAPETGGRFRVWLTTVRGTGDVADLVWDRKVRDS